MSTINDGHGNILVIIQQDPEPLRGVVGQQLKDPMSGGYM